MPALTFTLDADPSVFITLEQFGDLPQSEINFGSKTRTSKTYYGGQNEVSVQVLGDEYKPIVLSGVWSDRQTGDRGRAERLCRAFEALRERSELVVLNWSSYQRWGLLEFDAKYKRLDYVEWTITFDVLFVMPPSFLRVTPYKTPPSDQVSVAADLSADLSTTASNAPLNTSPAFLTDILQFVSSIETSIADGVAILDNVIDSIELTNEVARRAAATLYSPIVQLNRLRARTKDATEETISTVAGFQAVVVRQWSDVVDLKALALRASLADLVLQLIERYRPAADRTYVVRDGETLMTIAHKVYGDFSAWSSIADANNLDSAQVEAGTQIVLPNEVF